MSTTATTTTVTTNDVQREVIFTDYLWREDMRPIVALRRTYSALKDDAPAAHVAELELHREASWHPEYEQPEQLRSLARLLEAAADELEELNAPKLNQPPQNP